MRAQKNWKKRSKGEGGDSGSSKRRKTEDPRELFMAQQRLRIQARLQRQPAAGNAPPPHAKRRQSVPAPPPSRRQSTPAVRQTKLERKREQTKDRFEQARKQRIARTMNRMSNPPAPDKIDADEAFDAFFHSDSLNSQLSEMDDLEEESSVDDEEEKDDSEDDDEEVEEPRQAKRKAVKGTAKRSAQDRSRSRSRVRTPIGTTPKIAPPASSSPAMAGFSATILQIILIGAIIAVATQLVVDQGSTIPRFPTPNPGNDQNTKPNTMYEAVAKEILGLARKKKEADSVMEAFVDEDEDNASRCQTANGMYSNTIAELRKLKPKVWALADPEQRQARELMMDKGLFDLYARKQMAEDCATGSSQGWMSEFLNALPSPDDEPSTKKKKTKKKKKKKQQLTCPEYVEKLGSEWNQNLVSDYEGGATRMGRKRKVGHRAAWYALFNFSCVKGGTPTTKCDSTHVLHGDERLSRCQKPKLTRRYRKLMLKYHPDKHASAASWDVFKDYHVPPDFATKCATVMASLVGLGKELFDCESVVCLKCK